MAPRDDRISRRRRRILGAIGLSASAGVLGTHGGSVAAKGEFVFEQGERCVPITPLSGNDPVEELYDFAYPQDEYDGPPGSEGNTFSSEGTADLQRDRTSILFLYDGPNGLSLVMVHGHLDGDRDQGGVVSFAIDGLPDAGEWLVRDDYYLQNGEQPDSNWDTWNLDGDVHTVDWGYQGGRTDGGVFRGLGSGAELTVEPAFNEESALAADLDFGPIEAWEFLSGDRENPERFPLRLDRTLTIRQGTCDGQAGSGGGGGDDGGDGGGKGSDQGDDDDGHDGDDGGPGQGDGGRGDDRGRDGDDQQERERRKHVKQQLKHQRKHTKQQMKHNRKEVRERVKHQKQQAKHRRKAIKNRAKHRKD